MYFSPLGTLLSWKDPSANSGVGGGSCGLRVLILGVWQNIKHFWTGHSTSLDSGSY